MIGFPVGFLIVQGFLGIKGGGSGEKGDVIISLDVRCKGSRQGV